MTKPFALTQQNLPYLVQKLERLDKTHQWEVIVRERKSQRSLDQNKWIRGFAADFGEHLGYSPDDCYDLLMFKFCPEFVTDPQTGVEIRKPGHFSKMQDGTPRNTKDAAQVQDAVQRWAEELGFVWHEEAA